MNQFYVIFLRILAGVGAASVPVMFLTFIWTEDFRWFLSAMVILLSSLAVGYGAVMLNGGAR